MRLDLNLATVPYEDVRGFFVRWGTSLALLAMLTVVFVAVAVRSHVRARDVNLEIAAKRQQTAQLDAEARAAQAVLARPENRTVAEQSAFLNSLIARKAFSWTQAFSDLEKIMPPRLQVTAIRPDLNERNQLEINMVVAGESRDRAVELLRRLEESDRFREPQLRAETTEAQTNRMQFQISALYVPGVEKPAAPVVGTAGASPVRDSGTAGAPPAAAAPPGAAR